MVAVVRGRGAVGGGCGGVRIAPANLPTVADQEAEPAHVLTQVHHQVAGLLGGPNTGRVSWDAQEVHTSCLDLHDEQHVQAFPAV